MVKRGYQVVVPGKGAIDVRDLSLEEAQAELINLIEFLEKIDNMRFELTQIIDKFRRGEKA